MKVLIDKLTPPPASSGPESAQQGAEQLDASFFASMMNMFTNLVKPEIPEEQVIAGSQVASDEAMLSSALDDQVETVGELIKFAQGKNQATDEPDLSHLQDLLYKANEASEESTELDAADGKIEKLIKEMSNQNQTSQNLKEQQTKMEQLIKDTQKVKQQEITNKTVQVELESDDILMGQAKSIDQTKTMDQDYAKQLKVAAKQVATNPSMQKSDDIDIEEVNEAISRWTQKIEQPAAKESVTSQHAINHVVNNIETVTTSKVVPNINLAASEMAEQFGESVQLRVDQIEKMTSSSGMKDFHIKFHVNPEELGPVSAKLTVNHNKAELFLSVNNDKVAELVKSQLNELKDQLKQMNIDLDSVDVQKRDGGSNSEHNDQNENASFEPRLQHEEVHQGAVTNTAKKSTTLVDEYI